MANRVTWALIVVVVAAATAEAQSSAPKTLTYGDWTVVRSTDGDDLIAATGQDSDKLLGYRCFTARGQCVHTILMATKCDDGANYPVLINASGGSLTVTCLCSNNDGSYELIPTDWDAFHGMLTDSTGYVGFAIPLADGRFKVVRFSLKGVKQAMDAAETAIRRVDTSEYH